MIGAFKSLREKGIAETFGSDNEAHPRRDLVARRRRLPRGERSKPAFLAEVARPGIVSCFLVLQGWFTVFLASKGPSFFALGIFIGFLYALSMLFKSLRFERDSHEQQSAVREAVIGALVAFAIIIGTPALLGP